ncbi:hypothetical protein EGI22_14660 [Lacihabitans sp. LS3-19]|nr:hypothetical protein [Lacihabitans sp. LS3-19]
MKIKHAILILSLGIISILLGAFVKIMHYNSSYFRFFVSLGLFLEAFVAIYFLYKIFTHLKFKRILSQK